MRQYLGVAIGVILGLVGGVLYMQSMPPPEGSQAERTERVEKKLRAAEREILELRADGRRSGPLRRSSDRARNIVDDIRSGRDVDLDDVFQVTKPWLRDLAPLINRVRLLEERKQFNSLAGEYGRDYDLTERQQKELRKWLEARAAENSFSFAAVVEDESSTLVDFLLAGRDAQRNIAGIDEFMERQLSGQALVDFRENRLMERIESVEQEANGRLNRLDTLVELDAVQEDQLFYLMARSSDDYIPSMEIEGLEGDRGPLNPVTRDQAVRAVLRPEQLEVFEARRREQREEAERDLQDLGLKLPDDWDLFEADDW